MTDIGPMIENRERLTTFFGAWPSFHDAAVVDLHFWRGRMHPGEWDDRNVLPVLTVKVRILEATQPGATGADNDVMATLRFHDVSDFKMADFDHNNHILDSIRGCLAAWKIPVRRRIAAVFERRVEIGIWLEGVISMLSN